MAEPRFRRHDDKSPSGRQPVRLLSSGRADPAAGGDRGMGGRVFVTGGAGYVGSHVVHELIGRGFAVTVFDCFKQGHRAALHPRTTLVEGDLRNRDAVRTALAGGSYEAVLHFAANSLVGESMHKPELYLGDNVVAAQNLIEAVVEAGVPRFVLSSTANLF